MSVTEWNDKQVNDLANKITMDKLNIGASIVIGEVTQKINAQGLVDTGDLKGSTFKRRIKNGYRIFNNKVYALIHEFGGIIRPVNGKYLSIPINPRSKGKSPRDFGDLKFIPRKGDNPLLVSKKTPLFVLLKSVQVPARPYFRPGFRSALPKIMRLLNK